MRESHNPLGQLGSRPGNAERIPPGAEEAGSRPEPVYEHLYRTLTADPKQNRILKEVGRAYSLSYLSFHFNLLEDDVPRFMEGMPGFEVAVNKGGKVTGYTLTNPAETIEFLSRMLSPRKPEGAAAAEGVRPDTAKEIPFKEAYGSVSGAEGMAEKKTTIGESAGGRKTEEKDPIMRFYESGEGSAPISSEDLLDERNLVLYRYLLERYGDGVFSRDEIEFPPGFSQSTQAKSIRLASLEKACCLKRMPDTGSGDAALFKLIPPDAKREIVRGGPYWDLSVFAPEPLPPDIRRIEEEVLMPAESLLYRHLRKNCEGCVFGASAEEIFPAELKNLPYHRKKKMLKHLWELGILEMGYKLGRPIQYPVYRIKSSAEKVSGRE